MSKNWDVVVGSGSKPVKGEQSLPPEFLPQACVCAEIKVGGKPTGSRNWNPDCPVHPWTAAMQATVDRSVEMQLRAREARRKRSVTKKLAMKKPVKWSPRVTIVTPPDRDARLISIEVPGFVLHQTGDEFTAAMWEAVALIKDWAETRSW